MKRSIWLLALIVSASLACAKEKVSETSPAAADSPLTAASYTLKVTFEGLVGYVKTTSGSGNVWALLPKADPTYQPPPYADTSDANVYPRHYAMLIVPGKNVRGSSTAGNLQIPIEGYDLVLPSDVSGGSGMDLTLEKFRQRPGAAPGGDGVPDTSVDKLASGMLAVSPVPPQSNLLAARMMLPSTGFAAKSSAFSFDIVQPKSPVSGSSFCGNTTIPTTMAGTGTRIESVTWTSSSRSTDVELTLHPFNGPDLSLVLGPATGETEFEIKVVNKVAEAFIDPTSADHHWAAYRWFYNLSSSGTDCTKHYYPNGPHGGDRCPQKLYAE